MVERLRKYVKGKLSTWSQRRCQQCQRYLSKDQIRYCAKHSPNKIVHRLSQAKYKKIHPEVERAYYRRNIEQIHLRKFVFNHAPEINIGDIL